MNKTTCAFQSRSKVHSKFSKIIRIRYSYAFVLQSNFITIVEDGSTRQGKQQQLVQLDSYRIYHASQVSPDTVTQVPSQSGPMLEIETLHSLTNCRFFFQDARQEQIYTGPIQNDVHRIRRCDLGTSNQEPAIRRNKHRFQ